MSGYERSERPERPERPDPLDSQDSEESHDGREPLWPDDFTPEEKRFARKLREFYSIEDEILPPLYVQTMLDDAARAPLSQGYTRKLTYRVMRRLELPRRPLTPRRRPLGAPDRATLRTMAEPLRRASAPALVALSVLMALVIGSVYLATPSFAEGLRLLLGQTGAQQLDSYPTTVSAPSKVRTTHVNGVHPSPAMPVFWVGQVIGGYSYMGMSLIDQQDWSNGPVVEIQYSLTQPPLPEKAVSAPATATKDQSSPSNPASGATTGGSGLLDIREFQVSSQYQSVLLAVQNGSATPTSVDGQPAVYVDGMWVLSPGGRKTWQSGTRSMLIFERDGVIFWITGDQRDGLTSYPLTRIAAALTQTSLSTLRPNRISAHFASADPDASLRAPLGANTDALEEIARDSDSSGAPISKFVTLNLPMPTLMN